MRHSGTRAPDALQTLPGIGPSIAQDPRRPQGSHWKGRTLGVLAVVLLAGCGRSSRPAPPPSDGSAVPPPAGERILAISIEHTPCFGACPIYRYTFSSSGSAQYTGTRFVRDSGSRELPITVPLFDSLATQVRESGFLRLPAEFAAHATDLPSTIISVTLADTEKTVRRYGNPPEVPAALLALESRLDSAGAALFSHLPGSP